jgi:hypothetical protein
VIVTTGYPGKVTRIADGDHGSKVLTIKTPGGKAQRYTIEAGATIPDESTHPKATARRRRAPTSRSSGPCRKATTGFPGKRPRLQGCAVMQR